MSNNITFEDMNHSQDFDGKSEFDYNDTGKLIDPASFLKISLDPALKLVPTSHWSYEFLHAILDGDHELIHSVIHSPASEFRVGVLVLPLGPEKQTFLHIAALQNRPKVMEVLLEAADESIRTACQQQEHSIRELTLSVKNQAQNATERNAQVAFELDKINRLYHIMCEKQFLELISTIDRRGRNVLHYAAAARGVMVETILQFHSDRFTRSQTSELSRPTSPLFPTKSWISPLTGELWMPTPVGDSEISYDENATSVLTVRAAPPPPSPPAGFISTLELRKSRHTTVFIDHRDENKASALHYASVSGDVRGVRALLARGAEPFAATRQGVTCVDLAESSTIRKLLVPIDTAVRLALGLKSERAGLAAKSGLTLPDPDGETSEVIPSQRSYSFARTSVESALRRSLDINFNYNAVMRAADDNIIINMHSIRSYSYSPDFSQSFSLNQQQGPSVTLGMTPGQFLSGAVVNDGRTYLNQRATAESSGVDEGLPAATLRSAEFDRSSLQLQQNSAANALLKLVEAGEDINTKNGIYLQTPLHIAAQHGSPEIVRLLLQAGAIVDPVDVNGCTPLQLAAQSCTRAHLDVVTLLYRAGAEVNATNSNRRTALHLCAAGGPHFDPQRAAAVSSNRAVIRNILKIYSESRTIAEKSDFFSTCYAEFLEDTRSAELDTKETEEEGADGLGEGEDEEDDGMTPRLRRQLEFFNSPTLNGNARMIIHLHALGASLDVQDDNGATPLHAASKRGNYLGCLTLLELGCGIYAQDRRGQTALHYAVAHKSSSCAAALTRWDAEVGKLKHCQDQSGRTYIDVAGDATSREWADTLWESCAGGQLDVVQRVHANGRLLHADIRAPWLPVRVWETTRIMGRGAVHTTITGAARALAIFRHQNGLEGGDTVYPREVLFGPDKDALVSTRLFGSASVNLSSTSGFDTTGLLKDLGNTRTSLDSTLVDDIAFLKPHKTTHDRTVSGYLSSKAFSKEAFHTTVIKGGLGTGTAKSRKQAASSGGTSASRVSSAIQAIVAQRDERKEHPDPVYGSLLPDRSLSASVVHIRSGIGFRFLFGTDAAPQKLLTELPPFSQRRWGHKSDVLYTFPVLSKDQNLVFRVDRTAYVPREGAYYAMLAAVGGRLGINVASIIQDMLIKGNYVSSSPRGLGSPQGFSTTGSLARSMTASGISSSFSRPPKLVSDESIERLKPGTELTSSSVEKDFGRVISFLIRSGADINRPDRDGVTPLMLAAKYGLHFIVRLLLSAAGASSAESYTNIAAAQDSFGNTALHYALAYRQFIAADIIREFNFSNETADSENAEQNGPPVRRFNENERDFQERASTFCPIDAILNTSDRRPIDVIGQGVYITPESYEWGVSIQKSVRDSDTMVVSAIM